MKKLLVIIPAYNEAENIENVINELRNDIPYAEILVINDSSKDNTVEVLEQLGANYITTPFNLGYAGVVQTGFKYARQKNYEYVAQFDGDGQHVAKELDNLFQVMLKEEVDIVIGSRFKKKTEYEHAFFRKIGTWVFQKAIKISCGEEITDPTSGLQVLNKRVYKYYATMHNYPDYPDANLLMKMLLKGYSIKEVSVQMRERVLGESMHAGIWHPFKYMIKMFYSILIVRFKYRNKVKNINIHAGNKGAEIVG